MSKEEVLKLATGEVFLAAEAKEKGLVDEIGFLDDTFALTRKLIGDSKAKIIRYSSTSNFFQQLFEGKAPPLTVNMGIKIDLLPNHWRIGISTLNPLSKSEQISGPK